MGTYVYGKADGATDAKMSGNCLMDLQKTWDKIVLAARVLASVEDASTIYCVGQRPYAQRAIIKFAKEIGATAAPGRFTPGQFTNQVTQQFVEPRILLVADPRTDSQAIKESSYVNIPTIAFCGSDSPLEYVDVCIPGNNRGKESLGLLYWMLAREVKRIRGEIPRDHPWEVKVDLFIYRDPEEFDKEVEAQEANYREDAEFDDFEEQYAQDAQAQFGANANADGGFAQQQPDGNQDFNQNWDQSGAAAVGVQEEWGGPQPMHGQAPSDWNEAGTGVQTGVQTGFDNQGYAAPPQQQNWQQQQQPQQPQQGYQQQQYGQQQQFGAPQQQQFGAPQQQTPALDDWDDE
jgi:small subunit ribosomal protein SAe